MNLKQVSQAYNYLFNLDARFDRGEGSGQKPDRTEPAPPSDNQTSPLNKEEQKNSITPAQAANLVPITAGLIRQAGPTQLDNLLETAGVSLITPRYV